MKFVVSAVDLWLEAILHDILIDSTWPRSTNINLMCVQAKCTHAENLSLPFLQCPPCTSFILLFAFPIIFSGIQIRWQSGATSSQFKVDKSLLAKLRKESGSPFSKCHKALTACNNDYAGALNWLDEMSQKEGWKKVEKVKGRQTFQGLIGAIVHENVAAIVEVSCFQIIEFYF